MKARQSNQNDGVNNSRPKGEGPTLPDGSLSNVFPLRPATSTCRQAPNLAIGPEDRSAPTSAKPSRNLALLVGCSLLLHAALLAVFYSETSPPASIGESAISVDVVFGTSENASLAQASRESEAATSPLSPEPEIEPSAAEDTTEAAQTSPEREETAEVAQPESVQPAAEDATEAAQASPELEETAELAQPERELPAAEHVAEAAQTPTSQEKAELVQREKETLVVELVPAAQPSSAAKKIGAKPEPVEKPVVRTSKRVTEAAKPVPESKSTKRKKIARSNSASVASLAASDSVRGRSRGEINYRGLVAAHLARHKQFPADARQRGDEGTTLVTFSLDGSGTVTSIRLVRGSGTASFDQETQAMVRRASPFPAPPSGRPITFTVPIRFYLFS